MSGKQHVFDHSLGLYEDRPKPTPVTLLRCNHRNPPNSIKAHTNGLLIVSQPLRLAMRTADLQKLKFSIGRGFAECPLEQPNFWRIN